MISHFDANYLWVGFSDPENGYLVLNAPTMADVQKFANWAKEQQGVHDVQLNLSTEMISLPEKLLGILASPRSSEQITLQRNNA